MSRSKRIASSRECPPLFAGIPIINLWVIEGWSAQIGRDLLVVVEQRSQRGACLPRVAVAKKHTGRLRRPEVVVGGGALVAVASLGEMKGEGRVVRSSAPLSTFDSVDGLGVGHWCGEERVIIPVQVALCGSSQEGNTYTSARSRRAQPARNLYPPLKWLDIAAPFLR